MSIDGASHFLVRLGILSDKIDTLHSRGSWRWTDYVVPHYNLRMTNEPFNLAETDRLLSTTRAVRRRLDFDRPVSRDVILDCIRLSQQAPTASNSQTWRWLVVDDAETRRKVGEIYARGLPVIQQVAQEVPEEDAQTRSIYGNAVWLGENIARAPVHVFPCVEGRPPESFEPVICAATYGSIYQAVWSFQLALRSRGLGSVLTTIHLLFEQEMAQVLGLPPSFLQVAFLPVAYTIGTDFKPARRPPVENIVRWNRWDAEQ